jgi:hypothetical protein
MHRQDEAAVFKYPRAGAQLAFAHGAIDRLTIHELEVGRLRVRELITEPQGDRPGRETQ